MTPPTPRATDAVEHREHPEPVYEPPALVEIGNFAEVTRGWDGPFSDFPAFRRGYWLI
ncbi:MAG TPA: lasso RiPP family leader peptide-containing protein [Natronosporangium sp.]